MKHQLTLFDKFIHSFREFFIYHHNSLEFRAKVYTLIIVANENENQDCEFEKIDTIVEEIYPTSLRRQNALILTIKEYLQKVNEPNGLGIDELIYDIEKSIRKNSRFSAKINLNHIKTISECATHRDNILYQKRIEEYLKKVKEDFSSK
jgi:hypothetical protein